MNEENRECEAATGEGGPVLILTGEARWVDPTLQAEFQYRIGSV